MDLTVILCALILVLLLVIIALLISLKNNSKNTDNLRQEIASMLAATRQELLNTIGAKINENGNTQQLQLANLTNINEQKLENTRKNMEEKLELIRRTVEDRLIYMQKDNADKLEKMRVTVDEKLQGTLEQRLGESFKVVNDRLESVYKGLGEMQTLAQGVGDLKKIFTNVKARGTWGEIELGNILEEYLTQDQYLCSAKTRPNATEFVEFAIKLPGKTDGQNVLLPIDSKFPVEDYKRLVDAEEAGDLDAITAARKSLENSIKLFAKDIHDKYIETPYTTDFGIMFLPTESLYCEIVKNTVLIETLTQKYRVVVSGPNTFVALLNSLQMGFRTLAIEKRSSEVWKLLGGVKSEFEKFGDLLDKTNKKLQEISNTMERASAKTRTIQRKLKNVEALPIGSEEEFYGADLLEAALPSSENIIEDENYSVNEDE
ncbi:MAG: DNA recombination protein RmuC [Clostridia bacterium]|nr:DNA recombination protein RmuC [Clostridia bacterium]